MGDSFICSVKFTITLVVFCVWNLEYESFFNCEVVVLQSLVGIDKGSFFSIVGWWNFNPGQEQVLSFLHFITPRLQMIVCDLVYTYDICENYFQYSTSNCMVIQLCLLRDTTSPLPPLIIVDQYFLTITP